jgi:hypothetical protein
MQRGLLIDFINKLSSNFLVYFHLSINKYVLFLIGLQATKYAYKSAFAAFLTVDITSDME